MADSLDSWVPPTTPIEIPEEAVEAMVAQGPGGGVGSVVAVTSGGLVINLIYDAAAMAAPASFRAGIQQAAAILSSVISDHITVNLQIDYNGTGGGAAAGPDNGQWESYAWTRANLANNATAGDTTFNALPTGSTIQGQSSVAVWNSQLKLWGVIGANDTTTDDGAATFATDINPNLLVGVALHELTHAFARVPYGSQPDVFDFYRYTSPGTRLFTGGATAGPAYFSLDGGNTKLADYGQTSDPSDFLNSGVQGPNDPYNEFYTGSTLQSLTAIDLKELDALGFHLMGSGTGTVIQTDGTTSLTLLGSTYHLNSTITGTGPTLNYGGAPVTVGEFGTITPIGAVQTGSGYDIAWQVPGTNQFTFWTTDSNGNYTSNICGLVSGASFTSESLEPIFHQDFNHDGSIGVTAALIQSSGSTNLLQIADNYYMYVAGSGPSLKCGGSLVTVGEFGNIAPIAAMQTGSGYEVVWKIPGTNQFTFWATDSNGNYTSNLSGLVSGGSFMVESAEATFGHDFNGDGTIGVTASLVQTDGSTSLLHIADTYYMYVNGNGPQLKCAGAGVTDGEFGNIAPIGAIQTATGYEVAWKVPGSSQFTFWSTDANGNYTSNLSGLVDGTSSTVKSFEAIFHQDLNGDGVINASTSVASTSVGGTSNAALLQSTASVASDSFHFSDWGQSAVQLSSSGAPVAAVQPAGNAAAVSGTHDSFVFAANFGQTGIASFNPPADSTSFSKGLSASPDAIAAAIHSDAAGIALIPEATHDLLTLQHVTAAQLFAHLADFHIV
jgi:serralysin